MPAAGHALLRAGSREELAQHVAKFLRVAERGDLQDAAVTSRPRSTSVPQPEQQWAAGSERLGPAASFELTGRGRGIRGRLAPCMHVASLHVLAFPHSMLRAGDARLL